MVDHTNVAIYTVVAPATLSERATLRMGIPSKGRMAEDTLGLLKVGIDCCHSEHPSHCHPPQECQLSVYKPNPRQYVASISQLPGLEVWFQRASDVVRKVVTGDLDIGIVGYDMFSEIAGDNPDLMVLHDGLDFGHCYLSLGVPMGR